MDGCPRARQRAPRPWDEQGTRTGSSHAPAGSSLLGDVPRTLEPARAWEEPRSHTRAPAGSCPAGAGLEDPPWIHICARASRLWYSLCGCDRRGRGARLTGRERGVRGPGSCRARCVRCAAACCAWTNLKTPRLSKTPLLSAAAASWQIRRVPYAQMCYGPGAHGDAGPGSRPRWDPPTPGRPLPRGSSLLSVSYASPGSTTGLTDRRQSEILMHFPSHGPRLRIPPRRP
jgi:hypothetical protein